MKCQGYEEAADADPPSLWRVCRSGGTPIETVPVNRRGLGGSPRTGGVGGEHNRVLAKTNIRIPLITVHRPTMFVINGLPLSVADRKAAAVRIIASHPARSDRWIALVSGCDIARAAGIAPSTVLDVCNRISCGDERVARQLILALTRSLYWPSLRPRRGRRPCGRFLRHPCNLRRGRRQA